MLQKDNIRNEIAIMNSSKQPSVSVSLKYLHASCLSKREETTLLLC